MGLSAGRLDKLITILRPVTSKDAVGGDAVTWTTAASVVASRLPAAVRGLSGREALEAQRMASTATTFVTIRYRTDIDTTMRVVYRGRTLEISYVQNDDRAGRDVALVLWCSEVGAQIGAVA